MDPLFQYFDFGATFVYAISGALLGARRGNDFIGIFILAMVSSTGGGLLRDGVFLQNGPPVLVQTPTYLVLIAAATLVVVVFGKRVQRIHGFERLISLVDAVGLGAYAVVGMNRAAGIGLSLPGVILVGMVNAVGGGVLRSVLVGREPRLFRPGTPEASAVLVGCGIFVCLIHGLDCDATIAAWVTVITVFAIRVLSLRYGIETKPLHDFRDDWSSDVRL